MTASMQQQGMNVWLGYVTPSVEMIMLLVMRCVMMVRAVKHVLTALKWWMAGIAAHTHALKNVVMVSLWVEKCVTKATHL